MHKAKGLEWERDCLMSINNYIFPSSQPNDRYVLEKWFLRAALILEAETLAPMEAAVSTGEYEFYDEGQTTQSAWLDSVRERLRLMYVRIMQAKKEMTITWNTGRTDSGHYGCEAYTKCSEVPARDCIQQKRPLWRPDSCTGISRSAGRK